MSKTLPGDKRNPLGPSGDTVRANIRRLRTDQNLSYAKLTRKLEEIGREIPELGLRRIEEGNRRVDVDDLMALAAALDVSPATLLTPPQAWDEPVEATGLPDGSTGERLWDWLMVKRPATRDLEGNDLLAWWARSRPWGAITITGGTPGVQIGGVGVNGND